MGVGLDDDRINRGRKFISNFEFSKLLLALFFYVSFAFSFLFPFQNHYYMFWLIRWVVILVIIYSYLFSLHLQIQDCTYE